MASRKQIRLCRADCCVECGAELAAGDEAIWDPDAKTVTCLSCDAGSETVVEGQPGGSALDEHRRRQQRREQRARENFGRLGGFMMWLNGEPPSTKNWKQ